jgi:Mg2+ and Co2+ transporter CorA
MIREEMLGMRKLIGDQREIIKSLYEQLERQDASQKERDRMLLNSIERLTTDFQQQRDEYKAIEEQKTLQAPQEEKTSFLSRLFKR